MRSHVMMAASNLDEVWRPLQEQVCTTPGAETGSQARVNGELFWAMMMIRRGAPCTVHRALLLGSRQCSLRERGELPELPGRSAAIACGPCVKPRPRSR